jgi:hypothetical protein
MGHRRYSLSFQGSIKIDQRKPIVKLGNLNSARDLSDVQM